MSGISCKARNGKETYYVPHLLCAWLNMYNLIEFWVIDVSYSKWNWNTTMFWIV